MFYDYAKIYVKGGDGGNGIVAWRREKYVPMGGPAGGDGGKGGNVIFVADENLRTLADFRHKQHYRADKGANGQNKNMHGKWADDMILRVPLGTVVKDAESGEIVADLSEPGQKVIVAKGGRGGRGNARFFSGKRKSPEIAEKGELGEEHWLQMELKLLADVGLVGMPNAGKSTIISKISAATPKIADYPFTTLIPHLGMVQLGPGEGFVVADVPGLIEGAHAGAGLGHRFLRHVERTRVLVHVIDMSGFSQRDPWEDFVAINEELRLYRQDLLERPMVIAANKMDVPEAIEHLAAFEKKLGGAYPVFPISAANGEGLDPLVRKLYQLVQDAPIPQGIAPTEEVRVVREVKDEVPFTIRRDMDGAWLVEGYRVEKAVAMADWSNMASIKWLQRTLDAIGVEDGLRQAGAKDGETVRIGGKEFDFVD